MSSTSEQFSRVLIDNELEYSGWDLLNPAQVKFEVHGQSGRADEDRRTKMLPPPKGIQGGTVSQASVGI